MNVLTDSPHPGKLWLWEVFQPDGSGYEAHKYPVEFFDLQSVLPDATVFLIHVLDRGVEGHLFTGVFVGSWGKVAWVQTIYPYDLYQIVDELKVLGWAERDLSEYPHALELQTAKRGKWMLLKPEVREAVRGW